MDLFERNPASFSNGHVYTVLYGPCASLATWHNRRGCTQVGLASLCAVSCVGSQPAQSARAIFGTHKISDFHNV